MTDLISCPALPLACCVTLDKFLDLSAWQYRYLLNSRVTDRAPRACGRTKVTTYGKCLPLFSICAVIFSAGPWEHHEQEEAFPQPAGLAVELPSAPIQTSVLPDQAASVPSAGGSAGVAST